MVGKNSKEFVVRVKTDNEKNELSTDQFQYLIKKICVIIKFIGMNIFDKEFKINLNTTVLIGIATIMFLSQILMMFSLNHYGFGIDIILEGFSNTFINIQVSLKLFIILKL